MNDEDRFQQALGIIIIMGFNHCDPIPFNRKVMKTYNSQEFNTGPVQNGVLTGWCFGVLPETVGQFRATKTGSRFLKGRYSISAHTCNL